MFKNAFKFILLIFLLSISTKIFSQQQWRMLPGAPKNIIKLDDGYFINHTTGWVISGLSSVKEIFKTTNGGVNWQLQTNAFYIYRSIGFINSQTGWVGTLTDPVPLLRTTNGGVNWLAVNLPSPAPTGICGISVVDEMNVFGCGRYDANPVFIKTTNAGVSWTTKNLNPLVTSLVDCYFINKDSGFVAGGLGLPIYTEAVPVILFTSDGGANWVTRYQGTLKKEWCWKISSLNRDTLFAAIESYRYSDSIAYLRTNNGGLNWSENRFEINTNNYHVEGIGFISPMTGWIGGYLRPDGGPVTDGNTYQTTNGGVSWQPVTWGFNLNRFRFLSDTSGYAFGRTVYKYTSDSTIGIWNNNLEVPENFIVEQNYPNPFNPQTKIKYTLKVRSDVNIIIYDVNGKAVHYYSYESKPGGNYEITWFGVDMQGQQVSSGVYFYKITIGNVSETKKMVLVR